MGVRTTRHWKTFGQLVQVLHVCTVGMDDLTNGRSFDSQATWVIGFYFDIQSIGVCVYNQAQPDVRSTSIRTIRKCSCMKQLWFKNFRG